MPPYVSYLVYGYVFSSSGNIVSDAAIEVITSVSKKYYSTDASGIYMFDLADAGYVSGETVSMKIAGSNNNEYKLHTFVVAGSENNEDITLSLRTAVEGSTDYPIKSILHSVGKKPITGDNPLPVSDGSPFGIDNSPISIVNTASGNPETLTATVGDDTYVKTVTYDINDFIINVTEWVKQ